MQATFTIARRQRLLPVVSALAVAVSLLGQPAQAASDNATINLLNLMVKKGLLSAEEAQGLISQAETEARAQRQAQEQPQTSGAVVLQQGDVRVPYVSPRVREQIRDEIKQEVLAQAKEERWAAPGTIPEWTSRLSLSGDLRARYQGTYYDDGNVPALDFARINRDGPVDIGTPGGQPLLNTRKDRNNEWDIRARVLLGARISERLSAGVGIASGDNAGPVSTTQKLGGGFAKKDLWLDQGWINYDFDGALQGLSLTAGRFANPFWSSDLLFAEELRFDGIAARFNGRFGEHLSGFSTLGAFPLDYGDDSAPSTSARKSDTRTQWLFGAQAGVRWQLDERNSLQGALAYYDYDKLRGELSSPCYTNALECDTDNTRPAWLQKGNTLFALRQNVPTSAGDTSNPQYFGLAHDFRLLNLSLQWDTRLGATPLSLQGDYVRNLAYDESRAFRNAAAYPVNNYEGITSGTAIADYRDHYKSGPNGYLVKSTLGQRELSRSGQWNLSLGYKYLEPDAVPDAFTDPYFRLGGTNARGYFLGGEYAIDDNAWLSMRYLAAEEVYGDPLAIDVLQIDANVRF